MFEDPQDAPAVSLISLGCSKNQVDSERILSGFLDRGYRYDPDPREASLVVVNTCGFIGPAKDESVQTIVEMAQWKSQSQGRRLAVAGCLLERYSEELKQELPEVDHWLEGDLGAALEAVAFEAHGPRRPALQTLGPRRILLNSPGLAYLRISQGCDRKCSFCAIPGFKGRQESIPIPDLVAEANRLHQEFETQELVLNAQDLCRYGTDLGLKQGFAKLIDALLEGTEVPWIRFLYAYPFSLPLEVLDRMNQTSRLVPYLDMPFQHADSRVLRAMRRGHGGEKFLSYLDEIRARVPHLVVRSTMLMGHPGEDEEAFETALDFVENARFEWLGVFEYSDEDGTHAETLGEKVDPEVARERARAITEVYEEVRSLEAFQLGTATQALVLEPRGECLLVRLPGQAPDVDGVTYVRDVAPEAAPAGTFVEVIPEGAFDLDLTATLAPGQELSPAKGTVLGGRLPV